VNEEEQHLVSVRRELDWIRRKLAAVDKLKKRRLELIKEAHQLGMGMSDLSATTGIPAARLRQLINQ
jgi:hypothetical protein